MIRNLSTAAARAAGLSLAACAGPRAEPVAAPAWTP